MSGAPDADARQVETLYRAFAAELVSTVAGQLGWPRGRVEDGCQRRVGDPAAPTRRTRRPVAARLAGHRRPPRLPAGVARSAAAARARPGATGPELDTLLQARAALRQVAALRPGRRRVFERHLAGLTYDEVAAELGHLHQRQPQVTESRAELRAAA
jgi:hypothetical protein